MNQDLNEELHEHYKFIAEKGHQLMRLDKFLIHRLANKSRNRIQNCIINGNVAKIFVKEAKSLYADMVDSKIVSMMDARVILPKCMETFYIARFNLKDLIGFIKQRQDVQIQPEVDNIIATRIARIVCESIPEVATCLDFNKPDMHYVRTFRVELPDGTFTSRGTNLYQPEPKNDLFEYHEKDSIYQCRREDINGRSENNEKIFTKMWNNDVQFINNVKEQF